MKSLRRRSLWGIAPLRSLCSLLSTTATPESKLSNPAFRPDAPTASATSCVVSAKVAPAGVDQSGKLTTALGAGAVNTQHLTSAILPTG